MWNLTKIFILMRSFVVRFKPLLSCSLQAQIGSNVSVLFTSRRRTSYFLVPPLSSNKVPNGTKNTQSSKILAQDWFFVYCFLHQLRASFVQCLLWDYLWLCLPNFWYLILLCLLLNQHMPYSPSSYALVTNELIVIKCKFPNKDFIS